MKKNKIYQEIPGGLLIYKATGAEEIIYANDELIRLFGCSSLEDFMVWTNQSFQGVVHPEDIEKVETSIWEQIAKNERKLDHVIYRIIRKDQKIRYVEDFGRLVYDENYGDIFYVFITDITTSIQEKEKVEHKTIEQAREKAILRAALESTVYSYREIYMVNLEENHYQLIYPSVNEQGIYTDALTNHIKNKKIYTTDETWISDVLQPKKIQQELLEKNNVEYQYRRSYKGSIEWCITSLTVFERRGSIPISVILCIRSIDDLLKKEVQQNELLKTALAQAKKASVAKTTFLSNMSHDIRTPMNAILGYTEIASTNVNDTNKVKECLNKIHQASNQLLGIINDVLDFSKIEAGKVGLSLDKQNLVEIVTDIANLISSAIQQKKLKFNFDFSSIQHPFVNCDKTKLSQLLTNVLNNAIKYTQENGTVSFYITEKKWNDKKYTEYIFTIQDTGIGMEADFIPKAFDPFERENTTTISKVSGTGLGLAITKNLVELMKGSIEVKSQVGVGTEFIIKIPLENTVIDSDNKESENLDLRAQEFLRGKTVLVVEDNELNRDIVKEIFSTYGLIVDEAENGKIALEMIEKNDSYDFIIMDIQMPIMDGYETTKRIRSLEDKKKKNIPIFAMSANAFYEDKQKSLQVGMNDHLAKPIDIHLAVNTIYKHLI